MIVKQLTNLVSLWAPRVICECRAQVWNPDLIQIMDKGYRACLGEPARRKFQAPEPST